MNIQSAANSAISKAVSEARPELSKPPERISHAAQVAADAVSKVARIGPSPKGIDITA